MTVWDKYWQKTKFDEDKQTISNLKNSHFWEDLRQEALAKFGSIKKLKIIELGSGRGEISLLFALEGANITLVDESQFALKEAKKLYHKFNCNVRLSRKDLFDLKKDNYDIALSFGLAEHFKNEKRAEIFKKHYDSVRKGGMIVLSVPNSNSFPYRLYKSLTTILGLWKYGVEIPYSEKELKKIAKGLKIESYKIYRSSFLNAFYHFLIINPLKLLGIKLKERFMGTKVLNKYGYALIFVGTK